jgi:aminopeptidase-like protein
MGKRGLYPNLSTERSYEGSIKETMDLLSLLDGQHTVLEVSKRLNMEMDKMQRILQQLSKQDLIDM